jgi:hypothetical protein
MADFALRNPFFVPHIIHINGGIALKFVQAINGTEIKRLTVKVMAGSRIGNTDFHFADWIDWHGSPSFSMDSGNAKKDCLKNFSSQQLPASQNSSAADKRRLKKI